jgi:hypothetical protein
MLIAHIFDKKRQRAERSYAYYAVRRNVKRVKKIRVADIQRKMKPIVGKNSAVRLVKLRRVFFVQDKRVWLGMNILFANSKYRSAFKKQEKIVARAVRAIYIKICVVSMIVSDVIYMHITSSLEQKTEYISLIIL